MSFLLNYLLSSITIVYLIVPTLEQSPECPNLITNTYTICKSSLTDRLESLVYSALTKKFYADRTTINCCAYTIFEKCIEKLNDTDCKPNYLNTIGTQRGDPNDLFLYWLCPDYSYNVSADYH